MEVSHLSNPGHDDDGSIVIPLTQLAANLSPKDTDPSPSTSRAPVHPLPKVADLLGDTVPRLAAPPMKPSLSAGSSPRGESPPPLLVAIGSSPMGEGEESDPGNGELISTVRLVGRDAEAESDEDSDDDVFAEIEMEETDSIG